MADECIVKTAAYQQEEKLYQEELMEHFKYPHNKKKLAAPSFAADRGNPSCGDRVVIEGIVQGTTIVDLGFSGSGCVVSQAATSMLTDHCKGKTLDDVLALTNDDIIRMIGIKLGPTRLKCAVLCLQVLQDGIFDYKKRS